MKVMHVGEEGEETEDMAASVDKAINEISAENSMVSIDNVNSIIGNYKKILKEKEVNMSYFILTDLKVDVHRKNSSESIELMFYAPSMLSANSQQDQQSLAGTASNSKSIRSSHTLSHNNNNNNNSIGINDPQAKYISVYPKDNSPIANTTSLHPSSTTANTQTNALIGPKPPHLIRKSSEIVRGHQRRRLERQSSLDAAAESAIVAKLLRQSSDTTNSSKQQLMSTNLSNNAEKCDSFLHAQITKAGSSAAAALSANHATSSNTSAALQQAQRSNTTTSSSSNTNSSAANATSNLKTTRLQRHRSSETHDERLKQQQRGGSIGSATATPSSGGIFLSIHHEHGHHHHHHRHHHTHRRGGSGGAPPIASSGSVVVLGSGVNTSDSFDVDDMELGLGGSANVVAHGSHTGGEGRMRALQSWILGKCTKFNFIIFSLLNQSLFQALLRMFL